MGVCWRSQPDLLAAMRHALRIIPSSPIIFVVDRTVPYRTAYPQEPVKAAKDKALETVVKLEEVQVSGWRYWYIHTPTSTLPPSHYCLHTTTASGPTSGSQG